MPRTAFQRWVPVIALNGFSRFPIFYDASGERIINPNQVVREFREFVFSLPREPAAIFSAICVRRLRRRFVVKGRAANPSMRGVEQVPRHIYIYPDREPDEVLSSDYALGIRLLGARRPVFVPLLSLRTLTEDEAKAIEGLLAKPVVSRFDLEMLVGFLAEIGVEVESQEVLADGRIRLSLHDRRADLRYRVTLDRGWRVLDTNFCIEMPFPYYLPELVVLVRERGHIYVWDL